MAKCLTWHYCQSSNDLTTMLAHKTMEAMSSVRLLLPASAAQQTLISIHRMVCDLCVHLSPDPKTTALAALLKGAPGVGTQVTALPARCPSDLPARKLRIILVIPRFRTPPALCE
jgi:hypothetical protein